MAVSIAFANDCDLMSWTGYEKVHRHLDRLGLEAGDSFWLFDPSGGDMALFTHDVEHPGPRQSELLDGINAGRLDVLHSAGSYGKRFNRGFQPTRKGVEQALEYLSRYAKVPKIWSNHGDDSNFQNVGGCQPAAYHRGDDPSSETYLLDLLLAHGVEFFWLDRLLAQDPATPYRLVSQEMCRSGHRINTFMRYMGLPESPNGTNLSRQLSSEVLAAFKKIGQSCAVYQHWCCHHVDGKAITPLDEPLSDESVAALERLAQQVAGGDLRVVRLLPLLEEDLKRSIGDEAARIGKVVVAAESEKKDNYYYNQYHNREMDYFRNRVSQLDVRGGSALDAACGVGQWSFALAERFQRVFAFDFSPSAVDLLANITRAMRQESPQFSRANMEAMPYRAGFFDFAVCYGSIFAARPSIVLRELDRVLNPGGSAYICLNAYGWYASLFEVRFAHAPHEERCIYSLPLWNAMYHRLSGEDGLRRLARQKEIVPFIEMPLDGSVAEQLLEEVVRERLPEPVSESIRRFNAELRMVLGAYLHTALRLLMPAPTLATPVEMPPPSPGPQTAALLRVKTALRSIPLVGDALAACRDYLGGRAVSVSVPSMSEAAPPKARSTPIEDLLRCAAAQVSLPVGENNRPFLPDEFHELARSSGFEGFSWAAEGRLIVGRDSPLVPPMYEPEYQGQLTVWECLLTKRGQSTK